MESWSQTVHCGATSVRWRWRGMSLIGPQQSSGVVSLSIWLGMYTLRSLSLHLHPSNCLLFSQVLSITERHDTSGGWMVRTRNSFKTISFLRRSMWGRHRAQCYIHLVVFLHLTSPAFVQIVYFIKYTSIQIFLLKCSSVVGGAGLNQQITCLRI